MSTETEPKTKYLTKDLRRILIISIVIAVVLTILTLVNAQTNFLLELANIIMGTPEL